MSQSNRLLGRNNPPKDTPRRRVGQTKTLKNGTKVKWNGTKWVKIQQRSPATGNSQADRLSGKTPAPTPTPSRSRPPYRPRPVRGPGSSRPSPSPTPAPTPTPTPAPTPTRTPAPTPTRTASAPKVRDYGSKDKNLAAWAKANRKMIEKVGTKRQRDILKASLNN